MGGSYFIEQQALHRRQALLAEVAAARLARLVPGVSPRERLAGRLVALATLLAPGVVPGVGRGRAATIERAGTALGIVRP